MSTIRSTVCRFGIFSARASKPTNLSIFYLTYRTRGRRAPPSPPPIAKFSPSIKKFVKKLDLAPRSTSF
jgi:hypothetical protein